VDTITLADLTAQLDRSDLSTLRIRLSGKSASREAGKVLAPLFDQALSTATGEHRGLALHFEKLDYFNSSTIAALVQFIRAAQRASVALTVVYDGTAKWQAMSFDALRRALKPFDQGGLSTVQFVTAPAEGGERGPREG
jgi:hypothetical protein